MNTIWYNVFYYIMINTNTFRSYLQPSSGCFKEYIRVQPEQVGDYQYIIKYTLPK